jgi:hypothetical protein
VLAIHTEQPLLAFLDADVQLAPQGLAKNATEGLAQPALLVPATALLFGGQVLPVIMCGFGVFGQLSPWACGLAVLGPSLMWSSIYLEGTGLQCCHPTGLGPGSARPNGVKMGIVFATGALDTRRTVLLQRESEGCLCQAIKAIQ